MVGHKRSSLACEDQTVFRLPQLSRDLFRNLRTEEDQLAVTENVLQRVANESIADSSIDLVHSDVELVGAVKGTLRHLPERQKETELNE